METALRLAVALGIAVLLPMLVYSGVAAVHAPPQWRDFHDARPVAAPPPARDTAGTDEAKAAPAAAAARRLEAQDEAYRQAREAFSSLLFYVAVPLGLLALLVGGWSGNPALGPGLVLGGLATLIVAYLNHWEFTDHALRFATLATGLAILVAIAWRRLPARHGG
jgi:hypothetical protein